MRAITIESEKNERLLWMDVLRGLLILSVVIGHATGRFNSYIYQFHMGAFFIVSGYMAHQERRTILYTIYHRFLTTILPVFSAVVFLLVLTAIMNATGVYQYFFDDNLAYMGIDFTFKQFLLHGSMYVWWLGAVWFVLVLFTAAVFNRILFQLVGKHTGVSYFAGIVVFFSIGYYLASHGMHSHDVDLALIASFYYGLGVIIAQYKLFECIASRKAVCGIGLLISAGIAILVSQRFGFTMDWPSRRFNFPLVDCLTVLNGLAFVFFLSVFLMQLTAAKKVLSYLGRNTLPIVLFHFMWFNLGFCILYLLGEVPLSALRNFVPPEDISYSWWWLFVLTGIGGSLILWNLIMRFRVSRIAFGQEKGCYEESWKRLQSVAVIQKIDNILEFSVSNRMLLIMKIIPFVILILFATISIQGRFDKPNQCIEFPANNEDIFGEGWLPQSSDEDYRWVARESTLILERPKESRVFIIEGYVPESFSEVTELSVYIDDKMICQENVSAGTVISIAQPIEKSQENIETTVKIVFDAEHIPDVMEKDQRIMSALIKKIGFE